MEEDLNNKFGQIKERVNKLEDMSMEIIQSKQQKGKKNEYK